MLPEGFEVNAIIMANGMAGYIGEEVVFEHSLSRELVETIIGKALENKVYYEFYPYGESRMVLHEMREPNPESVEINKWNSRQKEINEEIEGTEEITGTHFSKFFFSREPKRQSITGKWSLSIYSKKYHSQ